MAMKKTRSEKSGSLNDVMSGSKEVIEDGEEKLINMSRSMRFFQGSFRKR